MQLKNVIEAVAMYFVRAKLARSLDWDAAREMRQRRAVAEPELNERVLAKAA